jgi:phosphate-selective porin OprO and OprP
MSKNTLRASASVLALGFAIALATPAFAGQTEELKAQIEAMKKQIAAQQEALEALEAQVRDVKVSSGAQFAESQRQAAEAPKLQVKDARPTFVSGDGKYSVSLRGRFQFDYANYIQDPAGGPANLDFRRGSFGDATEAVRARDLNDGTNFRRAQFGLEGKLTDDWNYSFIYEFGGSGQEDVGRIQDLYLQYNGFAPVRIRAGAFAPSVGLEDSVSSADTLFLERASASDLARQIAGADGRTGVVAFGYGDEWFASFGATGAPIATQNFDEQVALVGRVAGLVVKSADVNVHVGANATYVLQAPDQGPDASPRYPLRLRDRPEVRVDTTRLIDTGNINTDTLFIPGVELAANFDSFFVQGEYFWYQFEREQVAGPVLPDPDFSGWYVQASYILTGETRPWSPATGAFLAPKAANPLGFDGKGLGAWELAVRYSVADLNWNEGSGAVIPTGGIRGGEQTAWTVGLNWYVNNNIRFLLDYQWVEVDRLSTGAANAYGSGIFVPPAGAQIGQDLQVVSLRTQFTF